MKSTSAAPSGRPRRAPLPSPGWAPLALLLAAGPAWAAEDGVNMALVGTMAGLVVACAVAVAVNRAWGVALTALVGVGVTIFITQEHIALSKGGASVCGTSAVVSCAEVLDSPWSQIAGVPVSLLGLGFYVGMAWLAVKHARGQGADAPALMLVGSVIGVGFDVFLGAQMLSLGKLCVLCVTTYGLNLILLVGSTLLARTQPFGPSLQRSVGSEAGVAVVVGLVALIGGVMWEQSAATGGAVTGGPPADPIARIAQGPGAFYEQVGGTVELDGTEPVLGNPDAKYTLVEWADYQCPHCARAYKALHEWLPKNPDVKLVYKHYPISNQCNRFVSFEGHVQACGAAIAAECARQQGRFWELSGQMFSNQEYLSPEDIKFMVSQVGIDQAALDACMTTQEPVQSLLADVDAGGKANITGTPSIFVKGLFGDQWVRLNSFDAAMLDTLFAAARSGKPLPPAPPANPEG